MTVIARPPQPQSSRSLKRPELSGLIKYCGHSPHPIPARQQEAAALEFNCLLVGYVWKVQQWHPPAPLFPGSILTVLCPTLLLPPDQHMKFIL